MKKFNNTLYLAGLINEEGEPMAPGGAPPMDMGGGDTGGDTGGSLGPDELAEIADQLRQIADRLAGGGSETDTGEGKQPAPPLGGASAGPNPGM